LLQEGREVRPDLRVEVGVVPAGGTPHEVDQRHRDWLTDERRCVEQDAQDAVCLTPQPQRIARSRRTLAGREQSDDRVELVGERDRGPGQTSLTERRGGWPRR